MGGTAMWSAILSFVLLDVADDLSNELMIEVRRKRVRQFAREMRSV